METARPASASVPGRVKLMPHKHSEGCVYTVISGVFYIGLGDEFDSDKLQAYPPGAVIVQPGETSHFHCAKSGDYITQVTAIGPLNLDYVNPKDDPRNGYSAAPRVRRWKLTPLEILLVRSGTLEKKASMSV